MKKLLSIGLIILYIDVNAFESNDWQTQNLSNDIVKNNNQQSLDYFYYEENNVNYPKISNKARQNLPEVNIAGVRVHDGVMDLTDSSHMYFTFDGAVFIYDY